MHYLLNLIGPRPMCCVSGRIGPIAYYLWGFRKTSLMERPIYDNQPQIINRQRYSSWLWRHLFGPFGCVACAVCSMLLTVRSFLALTGAVDWCAYPSLLIAKSDVIVYRKCAIKCKASSGLSDLLSTSGLSVHPNDYNGHSLEYGGVKSLTLIWPVIPCSKTIVNHPKKARILDTHCY